MPGKAQGSDRPTIAAATSLAVSFIGCSGFGEARCPYAPGCFLCPFRGREAPRGRADAWGPVQGMALAVASLFSALPAAWLRAVLPAAMYARPMRPSGGGGGAAGGGAAGVDGGAGEGAPGSRRILAYVPIYEEKRVHSSVCLTGSGNEVCVAFLKSGAALAVPSATAAAAALLAVLCVSASPRGGPL